MHKYLLGIRPVGCADYDAPTILDGMQKDRNRTISFGAQCRVVVSRTTVRGFTWKVVCDCLDGETVELSSTQTFRTMHEAHEAGSAALNDAGSRSVG